MQLMISRSLRHPDHHLAEVLRAGEVFVRGAGIGEIEDAIDHRLELCHVDRAIHVVEHVAAAYLNAAHRRALGEQCRRIDRRLAGEIADRTDMTAIAYGGDRSGERPGTADLDDDIRAASIRQLAHAGIPIRRRLVIDHVGYAERARRSGASVRIHEDDASLARGEIPKRISIWGPKRPMPSLAFLAFAVRRGYLRVPNVSEVITFGDGATLDVPGAPRVVHVPGHTPGSAALHFPGHDAVFVGDALNTYAVTSGRSGPQLSPFNLDRAGALDSLARLEPIEATHVLPGHGVPWSGGLGEAVARARAAAAG